MAAKIENHTNLRSGDNELKSIQLQAGQDEVELGTIW
jgi:hypothetical protein